MVVNKFIFRTFYLNDFNRTVDYFSKTLIQRVLPAFGNLQDEADKVAKDAYERICSSVANPESADAADIADTAFTRVSVTSVGPLTSCRGCTTCSSSSS